MTTLADHHAHLTEMRKLWSNPSVMDALHPAPRRLTSTLLVENPDDLDDLIDALQLLDFEVEQLPDEVADSPAACWLQIHLVTRLGDGDYLLRLMATIEPLGGLYTEEADDSEEQ